MAQPPIEVESWKPRPNQKTHGYWAGSMLLGRLVALVVVGQ